jgi:hypothetical protein
MCDVVSPIGSKFWVVAETQAKQHLKGGGP